MIHVNDLFGKQRVWGGFGLMGGYTLMDLESYGVDVFGGVSIAEEPIQDMDHGLGEKEEDLRTFDIEKYIYGLFKDM